MVRLSFSTLSQLESCHKWYINKQMGLPKEEFDYFTAGKEAHDIIQKHVSGVKENPDLTKQGLDEKFYFPIVETKDFDENCRFHYALGKYELIGYVDGKNIDVKRILEIKTVGQSLWSLGKCQKSLQRKIIGLCMPDYSEILYVTTTRDFSKLNKYLIPFTEKDRADALKWVQKGIDIIEAGKFELEGDRNTCYRCIYRMNCEWSKL